MSKEKKVYITLDDLIMSGEKVSQDALKRPTIMVGFIDYKPRIAIYLNMFDAHGDRNRNREQTLFILPDYNGLMVMLNLAKELFESSKENAHFKHVIQGSKFTDEGTYVPGELIVKAEVEFRIKKGLCEMSYTKPDNGITCKFKFREPMRSKFMVDDSSMSSATVSKTYAKSWVEDYMSAIRVMQAKRYEKIAKDINRKRG